MPSRQTVLTADVVGKELLESRVSIGTPFLHCCALLAIYLFPDLCAEQVGIEHSGRTDDQHGNVALDTKVGFSEYVFAPQASGFELT